MKVWAVWFLILGIVIALEAQEEAPPAPAREMRGLWVATVNNIDWPSKPGLSTKDQQTELLGILDAAVALRLNAVFLQVRPECDALYESQIEPWSEFITGTMGHAPFPYYDPLAFAITEAHKRGLELHAWVNPFRVRSLDLKTPVAKNFVTRRRPEIVRRYGKFLWLDPTAAEARGYTLSVIDDLVRRYDIDGVHFDDYFYPYREKLNNRDIEFPDEQSWERYRAAGGKLARNDWRRENIDSFVHSVYTSVKTAKPWVKFGVSPFGIWRPLHPPNIKGLDAYDVLFADSRGWLEKGWVDYLAPQLYWPVDSKDQNFAALLKWWSEQNPMHRNLWPGMRIGGWPGITNGEAREVTREIEATRRQSGAGGNILWHARPLMQNAGSVATALEQQLYTEAALVPGLPWLVTTNPPTPLLEVKTSPDSFKLKWKSSSDYDPWRWVLEKDIGGRWLTEIYPSDVRESSFLTPQKTLRPSAIAIAGVDRYGAISAWRVETITNAEIELP